MSNCQINLWNQHEWELDADMLKAVLARMARHAPAAERIEIYPKERDSNGFMDWIVNIKYHSGSQLTIGCVQRSPGATVEFHS